LDHLRNFDFPSGNDWTPQDIPRAVRAFDGRFLEIRCGDKRIDAAGNLYIMRSSSQGWGGPKGTIRVLHGTGVPVPATDCLRVSGILHLRYHPVPDEDEGLHALWEINAVSIEPEPIGVAISQASTSAQVPAIYWVTLGCAVAAILLLRGQHSFNQIRAVERRLNNQCEVCGYNLHANQSGRCPECGATCETAPPAS
jgi:hypothetical protein